MYSEANKFFSSGLNSRFMKWVKINDMKMAE